MHSNPAWPAMDVSGSVRPRQVKSVATTARLLGVLSQAPPPSDSGSFSSTTRDELTEDNIFWIDDLVTADLHCHETNGANLSSSPTLHHSHRNVPPSGSTESFGILAVLSDHEMHSLFNRNASISTANTASRMIHVNPKPAQGLLIHRSPTSFSASTTKYHQSAPVKVPMVPRRMIGARRRAFDDFDDENDIDDMTLPPHEIVARTMQRSHSQVAAYSVLEGAGRTLKGRDLRQVRNAIWRRTGFLDWPCLILPFWNYLSGSGLPRDEFLYS